MTRTIDARLAVDITPAQLAVLTAVQRCMGQDPVRMSNYLRRDPVVLIRQLLELSERGAVEVDTDGLHQADIVVAIYE